MYKRCKRERTVTFKQTPKETEVILETEQPVTTTYTTLVEFDVTAEMLAGIVIGGEGIGYDISCMLSVVVRGGS